VVFLCKNFIDCNKNIEGKNLDSKKFSSREIGAEVSHHLDFSEEASGLEAVRRSGCYPYLSENPAFI
jgi:hypothetical protein